MSGIDQTQINANVDHAEIDKFSALAHKWWDKDSEFKPLHDINPLRLFFINRHASLKNKTVLDVGCGGGILTEAMAHYGTKQTMGIDMAEKSLKIAKLHALETQTNNVNYRLISVEDLAAEMPAAFDVLTCMEMLEHVPDPATVIRACAKLVKPGGWVFLSTLNRNIKSYLQAIVAAEHLLRLVPKGTHDHKRFITPAELARMCRTAGLITADSKGLTYNPITRQYRFTDRLDVNYMLACRVGC
ncbi:bifunctional 2-polyprenyl-6-hydroxyphenol methylase/3-demethylubiquinol 3-O-methyltransferase UbiG [Stenoxybacter acetivorans]|uniref:bifunctional 2-polyprenyl-6-hydroxyphenol methylase/3-demethylubiquinol 3-O-methyltransferase UbiG n=1 Tax=Stenoxybacter acetivorans TaxID=422441 RepID=UPI00055B48BF|nr:bifunctional 2-polyprenyl-6-hydroxyphenol methylase/3-demethylubiquinol 3-O-methyltransferase UbiG [Stenoxybacter acetivorans]